jgi:putative tryptophan/tyrosine transport system substrate-binding protein
MRFGEEKMSRREFVRLLRGAAAPMIGSGRSIVDLATAQKLPMIGSLQLAEAGGLMAYGVDYVEIYRHAAVFVDKIIKGAKPDQLPVEQPTKFRFVVNL